MSAQKKVSKWRVFGFIWGFARPHWLLLAVGTIVYCSQQIFFPAINAMFVGGITQAMLAGSLNGLLTTGLLMWGLFLAMGVFVGTGILMFTAGGLKTTRRLQTKLFRTFVASEAEGRAHSGERLSALNTDVATASGLYEDGIATFLMRAMPIVALSGAVFAMRWEIGLFTLAIGLLSLGAQYLFAGPLGRIAQTRLEGIAQATRTIGDIFAGGVVARVFSLQSRFLSAFGVHNDALRRLDNREAGINGAQGLVAGISSLLATGGVFAVGSLLIARGDMTLVTLMTLVPLCAHIAMSIAHFGSAYAALQGPLEAGRRIHETLGGDNRLEELPKAPAKTGTSGGYTIRAKNLTFSFQGMERPVLSGLDLTIEENRLAAFVGPSGGGKSTLLKAIAGLYERDDLHLSIGATAFSPRDIAAWRARFAYVDQSCTLFNLTIAQNIALGKEGATDEEIRAAAREANAHDFISALPRGYDTPVGEVGGTLSGGQRQRIAIARALVRRAPVLVFDEATSALDPQSAQEVIATIDRLRENHTILMATHDIASMRPDITFRVENGQAVVVS